MQKVAMHNCSLNCSGKVGLRDILSASKRRIKCRISKTEILLPNWDVCMNRTEKKRNVYQVFVGNLRVLRVFGNPKLMWWNNVIENNSGVLRLSGWL
jgi:hypothetical protein